MRARPALTLTLVALLVSLGACDSASEKGHIDLQPGTFEADVTGAVDKSLEGPASFSLSGGEPVGSAFALRLRTGTFEFERPDSLLLPDSLSLPDSLLAPREVETGVFLNTSQQEVPSADTYDIGNGGPFSGFGTLEVSFFGFTAPLFFQAEQGTVTVTASDAQRVSGTFAFTAAGRPGVFGEEQVEVSGSFVALRE